MKKILFFFALLPFTGNGQGIITTIAGTGTSGFSGDGTPANASMISCPLGMTADVNGSLYFADMGNNRVRKIDAAGTISTVAGNGTFTCGGDGGAATSAKMNSPLGVTLDVAGNLIIADEMNDYVRKVDAYGIITAFAGACGVVAHSGDGGPATLARFNNVWDVKSDATGNIFISDANGYIRKVNSSGIITSIAGNGASGFSGDGGPATAAAISNWGIAVDLVGNVYVADKSNHRIRKINSSGIITTIAGTGISGFSGDGGPATLAQLYNPTHLAIDVSGNVYFSDASNNRVRKINSAGIITTIAGNGIPGYNGDGLVATTAELKSPSGIVLDAFGNIYISDAGNNRIRKIPNSIVFSSTNLSVYVDKLCSGAEFSIITNSYSSGMSVITMYGDGSNSSNAVLSGSTGGHVTLTHAYNHPGTYTVKHVLISGGSAIDSLSYSFEHMPCNILSTQIYYDANSNCTYDATIDYHPALPITFEIDSNGVAVSKINATGGFYYKAYGTQGDIYKCKVISSPPGYITTCPTSGILTDTFQNASYNRSTKYIGLNCSATPGYDLGIVSTLRAIPNECKGDIMVWNKYCGPTPTYVTVNMSPKYVYGSSNLPPTSISGNIVTWAIGGLSSATSAPTHLQFKMQKPVGVPSYMPGDTVNSSYSATPTTSDVNVSDNTVVRNDIIRASYDPNFVDVLPNGHIAAGTELTYTIGFENTGNDTAHNIYVLDTLSGYLNPSTLSVIAASSNMNIFIDREAGYNVAKFDFPNIMLLDSSHHNLCDGLVVFKIKTTTDAPVGASVVNKAGIYFDANPVVMTNSVENIIGWPSRISTENNVGKLEIFPNPTKTLLTILNNEKIYSLVITNPIGQTIYSGEYNSEKVQVDVADLPEGVYLIRINNIQVGKFIKQ